MTRHTAQLKTVFAELEFDPTLARMRDECAPPVRIFRFKAHVIVYRETKPGNIIILRIRHGREDWRSDPEA